MLTFKTLTQIRINCTSANKTLPADKPRYLQFGLHFIDFNFWQLDDRYRRSELMICAWGLDRGRKQGRGWRGDQPQSMFACPPLPVLEQRSRLRISVLRIQVADMQDAYAYSSGGYTENISMFPFSATDAPFLRHSVTPMGVDRTSYTAVQVLKERARPSAIRRDDALNNWYSLCIPEANEKKQTTASYTT